MIIGLPIGQLLSPGSPAASSTNTDSSSTGSATAFNSMLGSIIGEHQTPGIPSGASDGGSGTGAMNIELPLDLKIENITGISGNALKESGSDRTSQSPLSSFLELINQLTGAQNSVVQVNLDLESLGEEQKALLSDMGLNVEDLSAGNLSLVIDQRVLDSIMEQAAAGEGSWSIPVQAILPDESNPVSGTIPNDLYLNITGSIDQASGELALNFELSPGNLNTDAASETVETPSLFDILFASAQGNVGTDQEGWKFSITTLADSLRQIIGENNSVSETGTAIESVNAASGTAAVETDSSTNKSAGTDAAAETGETEEEDKEADPIEALLQVMAEILAGRLEKAVESGDTAQAVKTVTLVEKLVKLDSLSDQEKIAVLNELADLLEKVDSETTATLVSAILPDMLNSLENGALDLSSFIAELEKVDPNATAYLKSAVGDSEPAPTDIRQLLADYYSNSTDRMLSGANPEHNSATAAPDSGQPVTGPSHAGQNAILSPAVPADKFAVPSEKSSETGAGTAQPAATDNSKISEKPVAVTDTPETNKESAAFLRSIAAQITAETNSRQETVQNSVTIPVAPEITDSTETAADQNQSEYKDLLKDIARAVSELSRKLENNIYTDGKTSSDSEKKLSMFLQKCLDILKQDKENQNKLTIRDMNSILARAAELAAATGQNAENAPADTSSLKAAGDQKAVSAAIDKVPADKTTDVPKQATVTPKALDTAPEALNTTPDTGTKKTENSTSATPRTSVNTEKVDSKTSTPQEIKPVTETKSDSKETKVAVDPREKVAIPVELTDSSQDSPLKVSSDKVKLSSTASAAESGKTAENSDKSKAANMSSADKTIARELKVSVESLEGKSGDMSGQMKDGKGQTDTLSNHKSELLSGTGKAGDSANGNNANMNKTQQPTSYASRYIELANQNDMINRIGRQARIIRVPGSSEINMRLQPDSLGSMRIQLRVDDNHNVVARIQVENQEARQMVENSLGRLKESLADQGLKVDKVGVDVRGDQQQGSQGQNFASNLGRDQNGGYRNGREAGWNSGRGLADGSEQNENLAERESKKDLGYNTQEWVA